jgi:glycosyltransferase involved in cell wall biosynthesis
MKIGIFVSGLDQKAGGAFSISHQILRFLSENKIDIGHDLVLITESPFETSKLQNLVIPGIWRRRLSNLVFGLRTIIRCRGKFVSIDFNQIRAHSLSDFLKQADVSVVWAVQPLSGPLSIPYVTTSWDIAHRISPFFPEFSSESNGEWLRREKSTLQTLQRAMGVVVGTQTGAEEVVVAYGINRSRTWVVPFFAPSYHFEKNSVNRNSDQILYPAHFWPHKNHRTLILALAEVVRTTSLKPKLVLVGSDKGSMSVIRKLVTELDLDDFVQFTGFVSDLELINLYLSSKFMIYPSLIGPDNLPPLEALAYGCPISVSDIPGAREQLEESSTYFDPRSIEAIANQIIEGISNPNFGLDKIDAAKLLVQTRSVKTYVHSVLREITAMEKVILNHY